jgi:hypothetical protein
MKVEEIKQAIKSYSEYELGHLVVELYKLIPKAKKEERDIDGYICNLKTFLSNKETKVAKKEPGLRQYSVIEAEIKDFVRKAKDQLFYMPNKSVSKKERANWRFQVKAWYKEIGMNALKDYEHLEKYADILGELYDVLCYGCDRQIFSGDNPFRSVGIDQTEFFLTLFRLSKEAMSTEECIEKGVKRAVVNEINNEMSHRSIFWILIEELAEDELEIAIKVAEKHQEKNTLQKGNISYSAKSIHNNAVELIFHLYAKVSNFEKAIAHFKKYYIYEKEIIIYCLVKELFHYDCSEEILQVLIEAENEGIKLRDSLRKLRKHIEDKGGLPEYMR